MPQYLRTSREGTIAAIDLGSNALRAIIARPVNGHIEVLKEVRVPLRLGEDVFTLGAITPAKMDATEEAFIELLHLFSEYGVEEVKALATSAMRDARNSSILVDQIEKTTGITIGPIPGSEEARLIFHAVTSELDLSKQNAVLIDIGGGSTEITLVKKGELLAAQSFNVGTVRLVRYSERSELDVRIGLHIQKIMRFIALYFRPDQIDAVVGTGGNLRRIGKIRRKILRKSSEECLYGEVAHMADTLFSMSFIDRVRTLELDPNRADVILPATMLVKGIMEGLQAKKILLPKVGLKEGIILSMLDKKPRKFITLP